AIEMAALADDIPKLAEFQGRLGESAATLLDANTATEELMQRFYKVSLYAQIKYDVDRSDSALRTMDGQVKAMEPAIGEAISWIEPELLTIAPHVIRNFMAEEPALSVYGYYFDELWRQADNTLSAPEERLLALSSNVTSAPKAAFDALLGVDIAFPEVTNAAGQQVALTVSGWGALRSSSSLETRIEARDAFFGTLRQYENTFATLLDGLAKSHIMNKDARGYESCLEASLSPDHISTDAYRMLINTVRENLPRTLHKYVDLRREVFGIEGPLTFPNLNNSLIDGAQADYSYQEAQNIIASGLVALGTEYNQWLKKGLDPASGWIDVYPNQSKRSGAYSAGVMAKDIHPYVLHNYDNSLSAVSTTAHEMGHALHSVFSSRNQPAVYAHYTTFLAEVASTCNEALLTDYMLSEADDVDMQLALLNQRLESIRKTIFRQVLFADFELQFHEYAEAGNPLTADYLNKLYAELITQYYGDDFQLGPDDECEWMFIPHFYYNFYVFTYATGLTSGLALASDISEQGDIAAERYINNMLKAGSSAPPLDILRNAGVDLETPDPIVSAMDVFEDTVAEFQKLWTSKYGTK
ncbi:MAG: oligoendopeptidase F, partial [Candidatus Krumholzibacteriia bacterium]